MPSIKPSWAVFAEPLEELGRVVLERWPHLVSMPMNAATLRMVVDIDVEDGDEVDWALVERVRSARDK